jgi:hypothetical protein
MARYKHIDMSPRLLPVVLEEQLVPGSFAHAVHHLVDQLDLSRFDSHLYRNGKACNVGNYFALKFRAPDSACKSCPLRAQCLRRPNSSKARQVAVLTKKARTSHTQIMRERIDSVEAKLAYDRRIATVEPVFANIRHNKCMNRFTLRGKNKVDGQWKLYALVHNIEK